MNQEQNDSIDDEQQKIDHEDEETHEEEHDEEGEQDERGTSHEHEERDTSLEDRGEDQKTVIDHPHEEEFYMNSSELVQFLRDLAAQIEQGNTLTIQTDNWDMPFTFNSEEIEVEIDREHDELEIEIEFDEFVGRKGLSVGE